ncbi:MAG: fumarylacetoacetate hydrolase family protein [Candidatus Marinimicrobia bacterium]|nr:fumarylacetoacetate hydrolase family protein [Candidatus Neomarinimicrobiota bacterium]
MKLLSYGLDYRMEPRLAFSLRGHAVDVMRASLWMKDERNAIDFLNLASSMKLALEDWERSFKLLKELEAAFLNLQFEELSIFGRPVSMLETDVVFFAPVPDPPSMRYFRSDDPENQGAFFFGNTQTLLGHQQTLTQTGLQAQGEMAAILGGKKGEKHVSVAGYCVLNNWFDPTGSGGHGLTYGRASSLGPYLVTADELEAHKLGGGFNLDLQMRVNGERMIEGRFKDMHISFDEMIKQAEPTGVLAGDIFCSGPPGTHGKEGLAVSGDRIEVEIQALGTLVSEVQ